MFTAGPTPLWSIALLSAFSPKKAEQEHDTCPVLLGEQIGLMFLDKA
jgi:hypothetical protein